MNNVQLRVGDLLYAAFKRWKMILALGLLGFICGFALSGVSYLQGNYTSYEISCSIAITSQSSTGAFTNNSSYLSTNDFHLAGGYGRRGKFCDEEQPCIAGGS